MDKKKALKQLERLKNKYPFKSGWKLHTTGKRFNQDVKRYAQGWDFSKEEIEDCTIPEDRYHFEVDKSGTEKVGWTCFNDCLKIIEETLKNKFSNNETKILFVDREKYIQHITAPIKLIQSAIKKKESLRSAGAITKRLREGYYKENKYIIRFVDNNDYYLVLAKYAYDIGLDVKKLRVTERN